MRSPRLVRERLQHVVDLDGELAGRQEHEAARTCRVARAVDDRAVGAGELVGQALEHRQAEGERLARPGLRLAADVASGEGVGDGQRLDREGGRDALVGERLAERLGHAEGLEGQVRRVRLRRRHRVLQAP